MSSHDQVFDQLHGFFSQCSSAGDSNTVDHFVEMELSLSQVKTIFVLVQASEPLPINVLADRIRLSVAAAGRLVDLLVTAGMVERTENPADRRVKLVSVTAAGRAATDEHIEAKKNAMRQRLAWLTDDEADRLAIALQPLATQSHLEPSILEQETPA